MAALLLTQTEVGPFFPSQKFPGLSAWSLSFKDKLTAQQVADLANWMHAVWGGQEPTFKPEGVASIRHGK